MSVFFFEDVDIFLSACFNLSRSLSLSRLHSFETSF